MKSCFLVGCGSAGSSPSASWGRSRGRRLDQTASASAAARKAGETKAARQASSGPVRASDAARRSSGRRAISQVAGAVAVDSIVGSPAPVPLSVDSMRLGIPLSIESMRLGSDVEINTGQGNGRRILIGL
jgi:hypothetical protein